ncbi:unnamed protein product [Rotaria sordida]|uniref:Uncharacterized protein n=1 Tax=Rotaria sordida TaxID=392033 RepID=A0A814CHK8_9BILA|nr:unnamed protein product [Rotaria sordida]CAF0972649.1 unnamed protein product [Rotaria sordida]
MLVTRELITDNELRRLADKYHNRHPTLYQSIYDDILHKFKSIWSTDDVEYKKVLENIFLRLNSSSNRRSLGDQIESIIEHITKYFIQLKLIKEEEEEEQ